MTTVDALYYQTSVKGIGVESSIEDVMYVPTYHLELWSRGKAEFVSTPVRAYTKGKQCLKKIDGSKLENVSALVRKHLALVDKINSQQGEGDCREENLKVLHQIEVNVKDLF